MGKKLLTLPEPLGSLSSNKVDNMRERNIKRPIYTSGFQWFDSLFSRNHYPCDNHIWYIIINEDILRKTVTDQSIKVQVIKFNSKYPTLRNICFK